ncbi:preprotein translocase subunit SecA [Oenococcus kitaharae]|nr:preprotein translocase subunit SecA [Oenococcus kitaharae]OEY82509.1 preprotein translocase subunit SecA [Oenococcus kitaharae]OEY83847.1 preprotein translocase subunit SecA [Oenococcus kitaharae]
MKHQHRSPQHLLKQINDLQDQMASLSDDALKAQTAVFKKRLGQGESLDDLLPEAFAVVREADYRVLSMKPFDVQVFGAIVLHEGNIAEMKTGEGKTLTATMPMYLNALDGQGAILVTANAYLAERDAEDMGRVYRWLGLSVAVGVSSDEQDLTVDDKKKIYASDIVYTTNYALGFDYLIDNLSTFPSEKYMRAFNYVLIDEVDSVLLDSAQTPLIISGAPKVQSNLFAVSDNFIRTLKKGPDFKLDDEEKNVWLTQHGIDLAERFFDVDNLFSVPHQDLFRHIELALKAHELLKLNRDYVVEHGEVQLLDAIDGRVMPGTKLQSGQHQAIEAKEHVELTPETRAMASITYQNLFRMFKKISGMTGTAKISQEEFLETYNMKVISIATNKPTIRQDLPDHLYLSLPEKIADSMKRVEVLHKKGQPVLLGTGSVGMSEIYSNILLDKGIAHNVLNAYNIPKEAQIVAEAGQAGAVTVATAMAGRGTDIKLGPGVAQLGGLAVIATEHMKSKRVDDQLRGRAGRQGDPGFSQFFVSLEDDLLIKQGPEWVRHYFRRKSKKILSRHKFRSLVDKTQRYEDEQAHRTRIQALEFDENLRIQRDMVYDTRNKIIFFQGSLDAEILLIAKMAFKDFFAHKENLQETKIVRFILDNLDYNFVDSPNAFRSQDMKAMITLLLPLVKKRLMERKKFLVDFQQLVHFERMSILKAIDTAWVEQVDNLQQLKVAVVNRQYSQKDPIFEYQREAALSYAKMKSVIRLSALRNFMLSDLVKEKDGSVSIYFA